MVKVRPFAALRPAAHIAGSFSAPPYDVIDRDEAARLASLCEDSILSITRPEINFDGDIDPFGKRCIEGASRRLADMEKRGILVDDNAPGYYLYTQVIGDRMQRGFVVCASLDDYRSGRIAPHESTLKEQEDGRLALMEALKMQCEPVFFGYRGDAVLEGIAEEVSKGVPDFVYEADGVRHSIHPVFDAGIIAAVTAAFAGIDKMYVIDGHHRSAAAERYAAKRLGEAPGAGADGHYNYVMACCIPLEMLCNMDNNRLLADLGGLSEDGFLKALEGSFTVEDAGGVPPSEIAAGRCCGLFLGGGWYRLWIKDGACDMSHPVESLEGAVVSRRIFGEIMGIGDLRTTSRVESVGGIRGIGYLEQRVRSGDFRAAITLPPVKISQIEAAADAGLTLPPKSTWFEPKLRSGFILNRTLRSRPE